MGDETGDHLGVYPTWQTSADAYIERFNRMLRYDWLAHHLFGTLEDLQEFATQWLWVYNHERPNMELDGYTPKQHQAKAA